MKTAAPVKTRGLPWRGGELSDLNPVEEGGRCVVPGIGNTVTELFAFNNFQHTSRNLSDLTSV